MGTSTQSKHVWIYMCADVCFQCNHVRALSSHSFSLNSYLPIPVFLVEGIGCTRYQTDKTQDLSEVGSYRRTCGLISASARAKYS